MMDEVKAMVEGVSSKLLDKKQKDMLAIRQKALNCSIQQDVIIRNQDLYKIIVVGAEPEQVIKGFKNFKNKCLKEL